VIAWPIELNRLAVPVLLEIGREQVYGNVGEQLMGKCGEGSCGDGQ
jgi:hypothetical protein